MTEDEYVKLKNRVLITSALLLMRDVTPGHGLTFDERLEITRRLAELEGRFYEMKLITEKFK